jgi:Cof subfamily protein (haloacid dehalogenase superfamily)
MVPDTPILEIGFDGIVGSCGTYGEYKGKEIFRHSLGEEQLRQMMTTFRTHHAVYILEGTEYIYYDEETVEEFGEDWYLKHIRQMLPDRFLSVQKAGTVDASKACMQVGNLDRTGLYRELEGYYEVMVHDFGIAEFVPKGYSKAKGIETMCEKLGIAVEDTIAVGDSINDVDMLQYAGIGVCMGNGSEPAKACADYITADIFEDGIYKAMEHFGLI